MLDILIKNANIITMNDALPVVSGGCIGIENGKISFVSDRNSPEMQIAAERIIDADGNIVMPGLINTHAHAAMCIMRGYADDYALNDWLFKKIFPVEGRLTREAVLAGVRLGIAEMLAICIFLSLIQPLLQPKSAFALRSAIPCSLSAMIMILNRTEPLLKRVH